MKRYGLAAIAVVLVAGGLVGIAAVRGSGGLGLRHKKPNVLLIEVCSLRQDRLGCMGYDRPTSPTIDALAKHGIAFRRCISQASWTKPRTASILTGLNANVHGLTEGYSVAEITADGFMPKSSLSPDVTTIAEALKQGGYETAGFVANVNAWPVFGVSQGFDHYDYAYPRKGCALVHRFGEWLGGRSSEKPFFAFMLLFDLHHGYEPPYAFYEGFCRDEDLVSVFEYPSHRAATNYPFLYSTPSKPDWTKIQPGQFEQWVDLYDASVREVDYIIHYAIELLASHGVSDTTAVVVVSDHGDSLAEHDRSSHGNSLYQELIHVPLIMYLPGIQGGQVVDDVVRSIDIYPTLCEYCGVSMDTRVQGESLLLLLEGEEERPRSRFALSSGGGGNAVQDSRWKLIRHGSDQLFDLESDPREKQDVSHEHPDELEAMQAKLAELVSKDQALKRDYREGKTKVGPEAIKELKSLGYL